MSPDPCPYCDFIGPFVAVEQPVRDAHRAWHDFTRVWMQAFAPLIEAFGAMSAAATSARVSVETSARHAAGVLGDPEGVARAAASVQARRMRELGYGCVYAAQVNPRPLLAPAHQTIENEER